MVEITTSESTSANTEHTSDKARRPHLIVGIDGSPQSLQAFQQAVNWARALGGSLEAVTTWQFPSTVVPYLSTEWSPEADAQDILKAAETTVLGDDRPEWFSGSVLEGPPARVLIEASGRADLLVLGSRGHGGFAGLLLGSVSAACAEHATCPVLIMHGERVLHANETAGDA